MRAVLPGDIYQENQWPGSHCRGSCRGRWALSRSAVHRRSPVALCARRHHDLFCLRIPRELDSSSISKINRRIDHSYPREVEYSLSQVWKGAIPRHARPDREPARHGWVRQTWVPLFAPANCCLLRISHRRRQRGNAKCGTITWQRYEGE